MRVLVVDDNPDAAETIADALRESGHDVRVAYDGPHALQVAETFRPTVAFLDIGLPVMDGYELARRLRERVDSELRIVAVTGYGQAEDRLRAERAGFVAHLVKPVDIQSLDAVARGSAPASQSGR